MRAGELRRKVAIQSRGSSVDSWGQQSTTWSTVLADVPAAIEPLAGRELELAQAINAEISSRVVVRFNPLLVNPAAIAALRVVDQGNGVTRYFNVQNARNLDERNRTIELLVSEGLNEG
jgi:SPP1 family predicted phage head-tail adaptor